MHNVVKWPNILQKSFLKYVWSFYNIMHESVKSSLAARFQKCFVTQEYWDENVFNITMLWKSFYEIISEKSAG